MPVLLVWERAENGAPIKQAIYEDQASAQIQVDHDRELGIHVAGIFELANGGEGPRPGTELT